MRKILLVPDSFKGTLSSKQVCVIMKEQLQRFFPESTIVSLPVADGGEGSVDAFLTAAGGERKDVSVTGPYGKPVQGFYGVLPDKKTAVIEIAACAGLPLVGENLNPEMTTTYGVGELILDAVHGGCTEIVLGLGGSCTNDGGVGAAVALGAKFYRSDGSEFLPTGGTLKDIDKIDCAALRNSLHGVRMIAMCDIDNPLYGENGAARVFASQKGADVSMIERLDNGLSHLGEIVSQYLGKDYSKIPGAGAAGGMGFGVVAFCGAKLQMGIDVMLNIIGFDNLLHSADLVFTGEGKLDSQSLRGKVISGVSTHCLQFGVPVIAVVGQIGSGFKPLYERGLTAVFSINPSAKPFSESRYHASENLSLTMESLARLICVSSKFSSNCFLI